MKLKEITKTDIFEVKMSPTSLATMARAANANVGIEFEMIYPNVKQYGESGPDFDADEEPYDIDAVVTFFHDGDHNGRTTARRLREQLESDYDEWLEEQLDSEWQKDKSAWFADWFKDNYSDDELTDEEREEVLDDLDDPRDRRYQEIYDDWREQELDRSHYSQRTWLRDNDFDTMRDVYDRYDDWLNWPHYYDSPDEDDDSYLETVATSLENGLGVETTYGGYHSSDDYESGVWRVETDSSLAAGDIDDAGVEIVTPLLPLADGLQYLSKMQEWAKSNGCYSGKRYNTGLHMNVSVPNFSVAKFDPVKLVLFLGDEYVLDTFGRKTNTYCKSALSKIGRVLNDDPRKAANALDLLKNHITQFAKDEIMELLSDKYTSVHLRMEDDNGWVEFRSPGGDWINGFDVQVLQNTLNRFVVALDISSKPDAHKEEYQKKLYQLLVTYGSEFSESLNIITKVQSGMLKPDQAKALLVRTYSNVSGKLPDTVGNTFEWSVTPPPVNTADEAVPTVKIVAPTKEEAVQQFRQQYDPRNIEYPQRQYPDTMFTVKQLRKVDVAGGRQKSLF